MTKRPKQSSPKKQTTITASFENVQGYGSKFSLVIMCAHAFYSNRSLSSQYVVKILTIEHFQ